MIAGIIIAKGKSTRLPNKNIASLCGMPLVAWTILQSTCSHHVDKTYVSTDSVIICDIAKEFGAEVIWRDYEQRPDDCGNVPMAHAIRKIMEKEKLKLMVSLVPTSPLRRPWDIDKMIELYKKIKPKAKIDFAIPRREINVMRKIESNRALNIISSKSAEYWELCPATAVCNPIWYLAMADGMPRDDKTIDTMLLDDREHEVLGMDDYTNYCYTGEQWQVYDIDYKEDLKLCEVLMEGMILNGRGMYVYYAYKENGK
jgi:CMP-N-acetylneuraminic acid synthetase